MWFSNILQCCNKSASPDLKVITIGDDAYEGACCRKSGEQNLKVIHLSSDVMDGQPPHPVHLLTNQDPLDAEVTSARQQPVTRLEPSCSDLPTLTPRQQILKEQVRLPTMVKYPVPRGCSDDDPEDVRIAELTRIFQVFVLDLHKGLYMTQVNSNDEYADIHCQLLDDLDTLKVDQGSGCIVEFPLTAVTRIYRIVRNDGKFFNAGSSTGPTPIPPLPLSNAEHIVVVEFMRRKLVLVFGSMSDAQSFIMCMELLVRFAQEVFEGPVPGLIKRGDRPCRGWPAVKSNGEASKSRSIFF